MVYHVHGVLCPRGYPCPGPVWIGVPFLGPDWATPRQNQIPETGLPLTLARTRDQRLGYPPGNGQTVMKT